MTLWQEGQGSLQTDSVVAAAQGSVCAGAESHARPVVLGEIEEAIPDSFSLAPGSGAHVAEALWRTKLAAKGYYVILGVIVVCVLILLGFTRPQETDSGLPSLRQFFRWLTPVFVGTVVAFFMAKPLFSKRGEGEEEEHRGVLVADAHGEAVLHWFVARLCRALRAPEPERICLSPRAEVYYRPIHGEESVRNARGFELVIGLPFIEALSLRELAGLIAHEVAFYSDSPSKLAHHQIKSVHEWLERMAGYKSAYEETVSEMTESSGWVKSIGALSEYAIGLERRMLRGISYLARAASCKVMRDWAFEADRAAALVAGSHDYAGLLTRRAYIEAGEQKALLDVHRGYRSDRVPENYPAFVAQHAARLNKEAAAQAQAALSAAGQEKYALQPSFSERLRNAMRMKAAPAVTLERRASALLSDYAATCFRASDVYYHDLFGSGAGTVLFLENEAFRERFEAQFAADKRENGVWHEEPGFFARIALKLKRPSAVLLTLFIVFQTCQGVQTFWSDMTRPSGDAYMSYEGKIYVFGEYGPRFITKVKYLRKGEFVGDKYESASHEALRAPSSGWFCLSGGAALVRCDEMKEENFRDGVDALGEAAGAANLPEVEEEP